MQKNDFIVDTQNGDDPAYLSNKVDMTPTALLTPEGRARYAAAQFAFDAATSKAAKATAWNEILHVMAPSPSRVHRQRDVPAPSQGHSGAPEQ